MLVGETQVDIEKKILSNEQLIKPTNFTRMRVIESFEQSVYASIRYNPTAAPSFVVQILERIDTLPYIFLATSFLDCYYEIKNSLDFIDFNILASTSKLKVEKNT